MTASVSRQKRFFGQSLSERRAAILNDPPFKVLMRLSLPTILMAIVSSILPLSDGLFLNNSAGYIVAGAVGVAINVINMLNALSQGLATAGMAMIGQLYGRGDIPAVRQTATQILVFGGACGVGLGILMLPLSYVVGPLVGAKAELQSAIATYLSYYSSAIPFLFMAAIFNAIKNATGQPEATFYRMVMLLVFKSLFNTLYLVVMKLGIIGAAMASLSAYLIIAVWMFYDLFIKESELKLSLKGFRFDGAILKQLLKLGVPTMLNFFMIYLGFFLIDREVVRYGDPALTAQTISGNINAMAFSVPASVGTTITTMVSINIAANQEKQARKSYTSGVLMSLILSAIILILFLPFSSHLVWLFLNNPNLDPSIRATISDIAIRSLDIYTLSVVGFGIYNVTQGAQVGLGKTKIPLIMGVLRIWLIRYLFILVFQHQMGLYAVFWGNLVSNYLAAGIIVITLLRSDWQANLIVSAKEIGERNA